MTGRIVKFLRLDNPKLWVVAIKLESIESRGVSQTVEARLEWMTLTALGGGAPKLHQLGSVSQTPGKEDPALGSLQFVGATPTT